MAEVAIRSSGQSLAEFKERTQSKVRGLRCPTHNQPPRLLFRGATLRDVTIQMSGCCKTLIALANQKIAVAAASVSAAPEPVPAVNPSAQAS